MADVTYEITHPMLVLLMDVCETATTAWDDSKANAIDNQQAVQDARNGWDAAESYRMLQAIRDGQEFKPIPFGEVHCEKCGDRTDTGEIHDCEGVRS